MTTAYKVVRKLKDGRLVSSWSDNHNSLGGYLSKPFPQLEYRYGQIIMQHEDSTAGIFCFDNLRTAIESADVSYRESCTVEVHEIFPIGEPSFLSNRRSCVNYPAVVFGRKVGDIQR